MRFNMLPISIGQNNNVRTQPTRHQFTYWDKDWNVIKRSKIFDFMDAKIEFSCGMSQYGDDYLITFGFQDNAAYVLKVPGNVLEDFIND